MHASDDVIEPDDIIREEKWMAWFLRLLALLYLLWGAANWAAIIGVPGTADFLQSSLPRQVLIGYLAVMMPIAAVGLWVTSSWGTVIWLVVALSEVVANTLFADIFGWAFDLVAFHIVTMAIYLALAWRMSRRRTG
ncbi:DUF6163 family protein [Candidatus Raskinella chloraquaticus]|jgi:hypothetical protein|uniref:Uncharacterized protein n=1 Tax=Candidatus Raskinella chloraquaticus TaxID=1951219 RepID=A0A1W9I554_9HYPH|nr:MAG: hypothetical protein A4S15_14335 [Proteobacteria bacterium SG_bin8]